MRDNIVLYALSSADVFLFAFLFSPPLGRKKAVRKGWSAESCAGVIASESEDARARALSPAYLGKDLTFFSNYA